MRSYGWDKFVWDEIYVAKELVKPQNSYTLTVMEDLFIQDHKQLSGLMNMRQAMGNLFQREQNLKTL